VAGVAEDDGLVHRAQLVVRRPWTVFRAAMIVGVIALPAQQVMFCAAKRDLGSDGSIGTFEADSA
jgi:hypothetical protein